MKASLFSNQCSVTRIHPTILWKVNRMRNLHKYIQETYGREAITDLQHRAHQHANGQFCRINAPFQPLANQPSCVTVLYAKNDQTIREQSSLVTSHMPHTYVHIAVTSKFWIILSNPQTLGSTMTIICTDKATSTVPFQHHFHLLRLSPACSATSNYFHLPPYYQDHSIVMSKLLHTANINFYQHFNPRLRICQLFSSNWTPPHLQKLTNAPEVPSHRALQRYDQCQ